jgi:chromosome segregation ATPase
MSSPAINEEAIAKVEAKIENVEANIIAVEAEIKAEANEKKLDRLYDKEKQLRVTLNKWIDQLSDLRKQQGSASDSGKFLSACFCSCP